MSHDLYWIFFSKVCRYRWMPCPLVNENLHFTTEVLDGVLSQSHQDRGYNSVLFMARSKRFLQNWSVLPNLNMLIMWSQLIFDLSGFRDPPAIYSFPPVTKETGKGRPFLLRNKRGYYRVMRNKKPLIFELSKAKNSACQGKKKNCTRRTHKRRPDKCQSGYIYEGSYRKLTEKVPQT